MGEKVRIQNHTTVRTTKWERTGVILTIQYPGEQKARAHCKKQETPEKGGEVGLIVPLVVPNLIQHSVTFTYVQNPYHWFIIIHL